MSFKDDLIKMNDELNKEWTFVQLLRNSCRDALESCNVVAFIEYRSQLLFHLENFYKLLQDAVNEEIGEAPITITRSSRKASNQERARRLKILNGDVEDK